MAPFGDSGLVFKTQRNGRTDMTLPFEEPNDQNRWPIPVIVKL